MFLDVHRPYHPRFLETILQSISLNPTLPTLPHMEAMTAVLVAAVITVLMVPLAIGIQLYRQVTPPTLSMDNENLIEILLFNATPIV